MGTIEISPSKTDILAFPFPAKGHINPMLHLCNSLVSKGFKVTFITTLSTYKDVLKAKAKGEILFNLESIPDGPVKSSQELGVNLYFKEFRDSATISVSEVIKKYKLLSESSFSPKVLIYDSTMPWMLDVAQEHGVLGASLFTQPCCVCALYYHMLQGTINLDNDDDEGSSRVFLLTCLPPLESKDLPGFEFFKEDSGYVSKLLSDQFLNIDKVDYILFNTFDKLEAEVANWMASKWRILTIGPIAPTTTPTNTIHIENKDKEKNNKKNNKYLFETNTEICMKWLDKRESNSVIYVSFGSIASLTNEQMLEIAEGLSISNFNFLWVVRDQERCKLPTNMAIDNNFLTKSRKSGLIINWCPQLDVLEHESVTCFMSHCGWNSTLEAISSGVSMIAFPQWADQTTNAKFVQDVWKIGVRVNKVNDDELVRREEIVKCVREVCERGNEFKKNAMKWKELAKEAVSEGGSSYTNFQEFASSLLFNY